MTRPKVLLTGGCGLVGKTLAPLLSKKYQVTHFDVASPGDGLPCIVADLRDARAVEEACKGMDAVIHVAAVHGKRWAEAGDDIGFEVNVVGTKNVLEGARKAGVGRVVFTSSIWATGHGADPPYLPIDEELPREPAELYGLTKRLGEQMCKYASANYGLSAMCLRPGGILPAGAARESRVNLLWGSVDVRDVARAHVLALEAPETMMYEAFLIMPETPLCKIEPDSFFADPLGSLEKHLPGLAGLVAEGRIEIPAFREWYTIEKAKRMIGYNPQYNFDLSQY